MKKRFSFLGIDVFLQLTRSNPKFKPKAFQTPYKINFGPGSNWEKPDDSWIRVDIDPKRGDLVLDFQRFEALPLPDHSVSHVYGSHVFEHMSISITPIVFKEIYRVLQPGGVFRLVLPDAQKSIMQYVEGNQGFELFSRRKERAKKKQGIDYTLFECMREDFLSPSDQKRLLGENALAHQNAWDYETIKADLERAGFATIQRTEYQKSQCEEFNFEGTFKSEANQDYRSLYVEAVK